ncbi:MAG: urea amidolyase associated protein UAAP1 [Pseudomonadota bacterium]
MSLYIESKEYTTHIKTGGHWSLILRRGTYLKLTDVDGGANVGMLFYNPENLLERYNAPDTLKCQHTFKLTAGNCLYSDMGRVFASIVEDTLGWHETVCGNSNANQVADQFGARSYQQDLNDWHQNGHDSFLVELSKYGMTKEDMAANLNWFSKVVVSESGQMALQADHSPPGASVMLRFEMDTLVLLHTCPHPLDTCTDYPSRIVQIELGIARPPAKDDDCRNWCEENRRGFDNNRLYHLGQPRSVHYAD